MFPMVVDLLHNLLGDLWVICGICLEHQVNCVQSVSMLQATPSDWFKAVCSLQEPVEISQLSIV